MKNEIWVKLTDKQVDELKPLYEQAGLATKEEKPGSIMAQVQILPPLTKILNGVSDSS